RRAPAARGSRADRRQPRCDQGTCLACPPVRREARRRRPRALRLPQSSRAPIVHLRRGGPAMSDLRLPVEVDSPSDARWERIGREMFAKLDASSGPAPAGKEPDGGSGRWRRAAMVMGAVAVAAAIGLVVRAVLP